MYGQTLDPVRSISAIENELGQLDTTITLLAIDLGALEDRLLPISLQLGSETEAKAANPEPNRCDIAKRIHNANDSLQSLQARIQRATAKLEI